MSPRHLYLHYVTREARTMRLGVGRDELAELVESERRRGLRAASLAAPFEPGTFTLSFDDAHVSIRAHAAPVLTALGVPATLFVPTGYVGTSADFLGWDDLRALRDAGWTLGAHSVSHVRPSWRFYDEDEVAHAARLRDEAQRSREMLERNLGIEVTLYAYPYGEDPPAAREAARAAGFARAFTVRPTLEWNGDPLSVPRLDAMVERQAAAPETPTAISVVVPAYERAEILAEVVTRLASQTYPKDRYEVVVVDDGSESDLSPIFAEMPENVRLLRPKGVDATFRAGQARQWGADHARYDHLAFLDADVAVGPDFLWHLDWVHRRERDAVVLGYLSGYNLHDLGFVHTLADVRGRDLDELAVIPDRSREPVLRSCLDNLDWLSEPWTLCYTGNVSMPKSLLSRVDGFAKDFTGWGLEDVDLGYRLHRAGARWVFSRWAFGAHLVDPDEPAPRNPFRKSAPTHGDFEGYLRNLALLERHGEVMRQFAARSRSDVDETCARPGTVGIEHGGTSRFVARHHDVLHRAQPGGVFAHELLDRVAYAAKVGAQSIYLLGGEPAEHRGFFHVLHAAKATGAWVSMQTLGHAFAGEGFAAEAKHAGLDGAVVLVVAFDAAVHDAEYEAGAYEVFLRGYEALRASGLELAARVLVTPSSSASLEGTLARLRADGVKVDEVCVTDASLDDAVRACGFEPVPAAP
ncbi:MAG: polysaccharide deacetylase family protein [Sandaracinus sp.]|nr:polysaccharide deacetylase family protein [Sandaracinus sp.]